MMGSEDLAVNIYAEACESIQALGFDLSAEELATLAQTHDLGKSEIGAIDTIFRALSDKRRQTTIDTMLRLSRLPQKSPKTFDNFDFTRIQGRDAAILQNLPALANLHARKNLAFIGPCGIGKTHLAQAYGRACCLEGYKSYYIKATELKDKLEKSIKAGNSAKVVNGLVRPSCLIIDEIGRCVFDKDCTDLFFDVIDRRYEKDVPNTLVITSNTPVNNWDEFFTGDDSLLCTLDRIFDKATVYMMKGASFRGASLETLSVEAVVAAPKLNR